MEVLFIVVGLIITVGVLVAIYEHRKKVTLMKHDFNLDDGAPTEISRDMERAADVFTYSNRH